MKTWHCYTLVAAVLAAPHLSREFALGAVLAWGLAAMWIAARGE